MILHRQLPASCTLILILFLHTSVDAEYSSQCPIGFDLSYTKGDKYPICYRLKGPEKYKDIFSNCAGNLYTSKLYEDLNISSSSRLWTEYKSAYENGPFVDVSFTKTAGTVLYSSFDVVDTESGESKELCVSGVGTSPMSNYTAKRCDKEYYRYCFIKPYAESRTSPCEDVGDNVKSIMLWSPKPMCFMIPKNYHGWISANWEEGDNICKRKTSGQILYHGWRYSNYIAVLSKLSTRLYPLYISNSPGYNITFSNRRNDTQWLCQGWVPYDIRKIAMETHPCKLIKYNEKPYMDSVMVQMGTTIKSPSSKLHSQLFGALNGTEWMTVHSDYIFENFICEKEVKLANITLTVKNDYEILILSSDRFIEANSIRCYTDAVTYHPKVVEIRLGDVNKTYKILPKGNGYYWCFTMFYDTEATVSNKFLWLDGKDKLKYRYALQLVREEKYTFANIEYIRKKFEDKLRTFIYYYTKDGTCITDDGGEIIDEDTRRDYPDLLSEKDRMTFDMTIKELNLDQRTVLLHIQLDDKRKPLPVGRCDDFTVVYMKPVYMCVVDGHTFETTLKKNCTIYSCNGSFTYGKDIQISNDTTSDDCRKNITFPEESESYTESTEETENLTETGSPELVSTMSLSDLSPETETTESSTESITSRPTDKQLQNVMDHLKNILLTSTELNKTLRVADIEEPIKQFDDLLAGEGTMEIPGNLLHLLDNISKIVELHGTNITLVVNSNVALLAVHADPGMPVYGLKIAVRDNDTFNNDAFEVMRKDLDGNKQVENKLEMVVRLPGSVANSTRRVSFVVFRNDRAFQSNSTNITVNSKVLSINVEGTTTFDGEVISIYFTPLVSEPERNQSRTCAYWNIVNDTGYWSQEGCTFIPAAAAGLLDACECTHLTHFAEIFVPRTVFSELDEQILEILSVIGSCLSIFGLTMVGMTAILFRSWRRDFNNKIWSHLCIAIFMLVLCFLANVFIQFKSYNVGCMLLGIVLHYSVLASFCWMLVAAVTSYKRLVLVFTRDATHKLLRAAAFGWGFPFAVVGILLASDPGSYNRQFKDISSTSSFCYPSSLGLWLGVYAPIAVMLVANWTLFILILRSVFGSNTIKRHGVNKEALRCVSVSCVLVFLFGLPWVFGLFATNVVAAYLFAITASFQGFVLFIFFVVGNKNTRDLWLDKLMIKQTIKVPLTGSTYANRSLSVPELVPLKRKFSNPQS